jgi:hypothetical protein
MNAVRRPSPALVISIVALLMSTMGTAYAALAENSVGTQQLKKNAVTTAKIRNGVVTGAKVKNQSLTGTDIDLATLGTVPSASHATTADSVSGLTPEPTHFVGEAGQPPFLGSSENFSGGPFSSFPRVGFYKDHDGTVHLEGIAQVGSGVRDVFQLPPGFRPSTVEFYETYEGSQVYIAGDSPLESSGVVTGLSGPLVVLSGIVFRAGG